MIDIITRDLTDDGYGLADKIELWLEAHPGLHTPARSDAASRPTAVLRLGRCSAGWNATCTSLPPATAKGVGTGHDDDPPALSRRTRTSARPDRALSDIANS